jgi:hypothetical protein
MIPLLFYSKNCPHSRRLEATLRSTPGVDNSLRFVCVDGQIDRIPTEIHSVPALLVPTSEGNKVVFETQMYEWLNSAFRLENEKQKRQPQQQNQDPMYPNQIHPPGYNQHVLMRPPAVQNRGSNVPPSNAPPQYKHHDQHSPDQYLPPQQQIGPDPFVTTSDASLCDVNLCGDFAGHLFAGAEEEIRIPYIDDSGATSSSATQQAPRGGETSNDNDIISQMMAARNQEISSVYSNISKPVG